MTDYLKYRVDMKSADMLEFVSDSIIGKLIRWKTGKDVNHTSLLLRLNEFRGLADRVFTLESLGSGIELHLLSERIGSFKGSIYWYQLKPEYDKYRKDISAWALKQIDKKYDYPGLFANLFGKVNLDSKLYFCSEFVHTAYKEVGLICNTEASVPGEFDKYNLHCKRVKIK